MKITNACNHAHQLSDQRKQSWCALSTSCIQFYFSLFLILGMGDGRRSCVSPSFAFENSLSSPLSSFTHCNTIPFPKQLFQISTKKTLSPTTTIQPHRNYETQLHVFGRPDWMRRAGRIETKKKERKAYDSFRKRQSELGVGRKYKCLNQPAPKQSDTYSELCTGKDNKGDSIFYYYNDEEDSSRHVYEDDDGVLNVYLEVPVNDWEAEDKTNIINKLSNGEIVTAVGPTRGVWIEHDGGGWSPTIVNGHTRLQLIVEEE